MFKSPPLDSKFNLLYQIHVSLWSVLSYDLSSYAPTSAGYTTNNIGPLEPEKVPYYHPKPKRDLEFSLNNPRLTMRQRLFFEENGFVVIPQLVPEDLLDHCQERFLDIVSGKVNKGKSFQNQGCHKTMAV